MSNRSLNGPGRNAGPGPLGLTLPQLSDGVPKGYLRVLVFDADSALVSQHTRQLRGTALNNYDSLRVQVVVPQDGYVSAYVGNESDVDVYFDDISVVHGQGLQVQETQYDPTGLELAGLAGTTPGLKRLSQYKFNGKEFQTDLGLSWNHQDWRFFDPQLMRWHVVDPLVEAGQETWTPYQFGYDNAVRYSDPNGQKPNNNYDIYANGKINFTATNDRTDTFVVHNGKGGTTASYTMDKHTTSNGTTLVNFPTSGNSWVKTNTNDQNYIRPNEAAALIGASASYKELTGHNIQINQLTSYNGNHSGHPTKSGMADVRYANKNGDSKQIVLTTGTNFDKANSQLLASQFAKFGFNQPASILTENGSSTGPALNGTTFPSNTFSNGQRNFTHQNHMHLQKYNNSQVQFSQSLGIPWWANGMAGH